MNILLNIIYYIVPFIILLGVLVFVHEFGHFIVARMLKVKVVAFSIGFGKELWGRIDKYGTRWKISAIPLGGYCQFLGDADASSSTVDRALDGLSDEDKKGAFPLQPAWKKIAIVVAGPLFNYLFAIMVFATLFYSYGRMVYPSVVGKVMEDGAAKEAGVMEGDRIISLNGKKTPDFAALSNEVMLAETDSAILEIERPFSYRLKARGVSFVLNNEQKKENILGIVFGDLPLENAEKQQNEIVILEVIEGSAAEEAGLLGDDVIESVDNKSIASALEFRDYVKEHADSQIDITVKRKIHLTVQLKDTTYQPDGGQKIKRRMLGVQSSPQVTFSEKINLPRSIYEGFKESYNLTMMTLRGLGQMVTGARGGKEVGGIIRIAEMSGDISKQGGLISFIYFMALLSVNLGLINLLPIPVLDGGSLVIFIIEMVIGKELKANIKEHIFRLGLLIILGIMLYATWNDIVHLISRWFD